MTTKRRDFIKGVGEPVMTHRAPALPEAEEQIALPLAADEAEKSEIL